MKEKRTYRKKGYLKKLNQQGSPNHIFTFDTETYITNHTDGSISFPFRLGYVEYFKLDNKGDVVLSDEHRIGGKKDFISFIESKLKSKDKAYIFAHNIGFDARVLDLFEYLAEIGYTSEPPIINNFVFIWIAKKGKKQILLVDTANFGVRSVDQLGKDLGYVKGSVDFNDVDDEDLYVYCVRDVKILSTFILDYIKFIRQHDLGNFKLTLAGQALQAYRTKFNKSDIYIHMNVGALEIERDSYYGGRTEAFRLGYLGCDEYFYLDVNSMYPYTMKYCELPTKQVGYIRNPKVSDLMEYSEYYMIADVTLDTKNNAYPFRVSGDRKTYNYLENPYNIEQYPELQSKRLIFPIGTFRTTLHQPEISFALDNEDIVRVHRLYLYETSLPFDKYVDEFYLLKSEYTELGNKTWRYISKLFLNSLYGKFGQLLPHRSIENENVKTKIGRLPMIDRKSGERYQLLYWFYKLYKEYKKGETAFSSPAIAGAITAYARMLLYEYMLIAGLDNVYYVDTDSIITNRKGYENLIPNVDDLELGKLALEHRSRRLIIYGNKDYRFDYVQRHKGIPKTSRKIGKDLWEYVQFEGFITWLNNGGIAGMNGRTALKSRKGLYHKGIIEDVLGYSVISPYYLLEPYS